MLMRHFNTEQKKAITKLAYGMMMADNLMREEERDIVAALDHELGVASQMKAADFHQPVDLSLFDTPEAKVAVMLKLFAIAYSDRRMHAAEAEILRAYARQLGATAEQFDAMNEWGMRHYLLVEQAKSMVQSFSQSGAAKPR